MTSLNPQGKGTKYAKNANNGASNGKEHGK